ncbi:MAG: HAD family hydrolase [Bacteriovoracaceae bacterium]
MKTLENIDAVIFDLGGVILNLDYNLTVIEFEKHVEGLDRNVFFGKKEQLPFFSAYEVGKISTEEFIKSFNDYYMKNFSYEDFKSYWNAMILDIPLGRIELIRSLKTQGKKVFLLSNINHLHEIAVEERFKELGETSNFLSLFDKGYYSHHIGLRKPTTEIFDYVMKEQNLTPDRTVFIDDSVHHVEGARLVGINAVHLSDGQPLETQTYLYA